MILPSALSLYSGGTGSGCNPEAGKCGRRSDRAEIARRTYVPLTATKLLAAKANELLVAKVTKGMSTPNNSPFDVLVGKKVGIEVKTLFDTAKRDKITMHPESRQRKFDYIKKAGIKKAFTVAFDERSGKVYYAQGLKSFRLRNMIETSVKKLGDVLK